MGCTEFYVFLLLVVVGLLIQARSGQFFTSNNIVDIASAMIVPGIFAVGIHMVLVSGGMDVSFPALASLSAYATTKLLLEIGYEGTVLVPLAIAAVIGACLGAFNGYFIGYLNLPPMIVTLGADGAVFASMNGEKGWCPARKVEVRDTTGAGDAFCAGAVIGMTHGKNMAEACKIGTTLSASVITTSESVCPRFQPRELGLDIDVVD